MTKPKTKRTNKTHYFKSLGLSFECTHEEYFPNWGEFEDEDDEDVEAPVVLMLESDFTKLKNAIEVAAKEYDLFRKCLTMAVDNIYGQDEK